MSAPPFLFMIMLGCKPPGRNTEQHDIYFGIAPSINDMKKELLDFWPEAGGKIHLDAWRSVTFVDGYQVSVKAINEPAEHSAERLFFLNLGGYQMDVFDELHYKMLVVAKNKAEAVRKAKESAFYNNTGFKYAPSHIDDKFGVDIDELFEIEEILSDDLKSRYRLCLSPVLEEGKDEIHLGYMKLDQTFV